MEARSYSLDLLRIFACLAVIMIHSSGAPIMFNRVEVGGVWYMEYLTLNVMSRWSVPIFVMLTGFFMINPDKEVTIRQLYSKYILRLFVSLFFWSAFYALFYKTSLFPLGSQEGHLWYVGMILGVYLAIPILRFVAQNQLLLKYFIIVWLAFMCYRFCGDFIELPIDFRGTVFAKYTGYALFGYYLRTIIKPLSETKHKRWLHVLIYSFGLLGLMSMLVPMVITQGDEIPFYSYTSPGIIAVCTAIFTFFISHPITLPAKLGKWVRHCSSCTYGIYLMHIWFLVQIGNRIHRYIQLPIPWCIICVTIAFVGAYFVTSIIKKIPILNKYIV